MDNKDDEITLALPTITTIVSLLLLLAFPYIGWLAIPSCGLGLLFSASSFHWRIKARRVLAQKKISL